MDNYIARGDRQLFTLTATQKSGDVLVVGTGLLGILENDGVSGEAVDAAIEGVFKLPKVSAAVIVRGDSVFWDNSASEVDDNAATKATGDFTCGWAQEAAGAGVLFVNVKINTSPPPVT